MLFVDDDALLRRTVGRLLDRAQIPFQMASGGPEALSTLDGEPSRFSVVIADYQMPEMDGVSLLQEVAVSAPWATRILVSGRLSLNNAVNAVNSGAIFQIITKPLAPQGLIAMIRRAQDRADLAHHNARLLTELRRKNRDLAELNERLDHRVRTRTVALLRAVAAAVDVRTGDHNGRSVRLAAYARRIGQQLDLAPEQLQAIEYGVLMHGIGTISVPDRLLQPAAQLTAEEAAQLNQLRTQGADMLDALDFLRDAADIVRYQNERFDGSGGPYGLVREDIPMGARILQLVVLLESATRDRSASVDWSAARERIRAGAGTVLDPAVIDAFEQVMDDEWADIRRANSESIETQPIPLT